MLRRLLLAAALLLGIVSSGHAQTVPTTFWGMHVNDTTGTTWPKMFVGTCRVWDASYNGTATHWKNIEPTQNGWVTPALEGVLGVFASHGCTDIVYTIGDVPGFANGNAARGVLPTNLTVLTDFVTWLLTNYPQITKLEVWNEWNLATWCVCTAAQIYAVNQAVYTAAHLANPNIQVLAPSTTGYSGIAAANSFYALGPTIDATNIHGYAIKTSQSGQIAQPPEQHWNILQIYKAMFSYYGYGSLPFYVTEGSWGDGTVISTVALQTPYAPVYLALTASAGIVEQGWYAFCGPNWGVLCQTGGILGLSIPGAAYRNMMGALFGVTFTTPIARVPGTNGVRNPTFGGNMAGTPGTVGTNMSVNNPDSGHGMSTQVVGVTSDSCLLFRLFGTADSGASGFVQLFFETGTGMPAVLGQQTYVSLTSTLYAGSTANLTDVALELFETNSGGTTVGSTDIFFPYLPMAFPVVQQYAGQTINAAVANVRFLNKYEYPAPSGAIDMTEKICLPNADTGRRWSGSGTRDSATGAPTRFEIDWVSDGVATAYSPPGTYAFSRSSTGQVSPISGGSVTLTNQPVILENTAWRGLISP